MAAIVGFACISAIGMRLGSWFVRILTALKLGLLLVLVVWGFGLGKGHWANLSPIALQRPGSKPLIPALVGGVIAAFFTFGGWWDASKVASEVKDSTRNMRRALVLGVSIVTLVYLVISLEFFYLVSESRTLSKGGFAAAAGAALFGTAGSVVFAWIVLVCVLGSMLAIGIAAPRAYFAMAKDGLFLPGVAVMSKRLGTPARAIALEALIACLYVAFAGTFEQMLAFFVAPMIIFLAMVVGSVYRFGGSSKDGPEFAIPGYPLTPLLFIVPSLCLVPLLVLENPATRQLASDWLCLACLYTG